MAAKSSKSTREAAVYRAVECGFDLVDGHLVWVSREKDISMEKNMVPMYRNKRADELTREELIEAYTHVVEALEDERRFSRQCLSMDELFRETARSLRRARQ